MAWNEQYGHLFVRGFLKASHCEKEVASYSVFKLRELCKLHDNLMPLYMTGTFLKLNVFVFRYEAKILRSTFWRPDFSIWRLKKKIQSPLGACIKQLISDPAVGKFLAGNPSYLVYEHVFGDAAYCAKHFFVQKVLLHLL